MPTEWSRAIIALTKSAMKLFTEPQKFRNLASKDLPSELDHDKHGGASTLKEIVHVKIFKVWGDLAMVAGFGKDSGFNCRYSLHYPASFALFFSIGSHSHLQGREHGLEGQSIGSHETCCGINHASGIKAELFPFLM